MKSLGGETDSVGGNGSCTELEMLNGGCSSGWCLGWDPGRRGTGLDVGPQRLGATLPHPLLTVDPGLLITFVRVPRPNSNVGAGAGCSPSTHTTKLSSDAVYPEMPQVKGTAPQDAPFPRRPHCGCQPQALARNLCSYPTID